MSDHDIKALTFTAEQTRVKSRIDRLVREHVDPSAVETDKTGIYPRHVLEVLGRAGILSMLVPKSMGGAGEDFVSATLVLEALGKSCASTAMTVLMHSTTVPYICACLRKDQHEAILNPLLEGKHIGALAMSEPETGSRLWYMSGYAEPEGDMFNVHSFKSFVTGSRSVDFYLVPVRSSQSAAPNDLSVFWISADTPNINPLGEWDGMGLRGNSSTPIKFDGCPVPAAHMIGRPSDGFSLLMAYVLPLYFVGLSAVYLGIAEGAYAAAVEKLKSRRYPDTGDAASDIESSQRAVGEMKSRLVQLRASIYRCARMINQSAELFELLKKADLLTDILENAQKDSFFVEVAQLKVAASECAQFVADTALRVYGGQGYKRGNPVERAVRDARAGALMGPSNDILKVIIGRRELGLPYPWEDKVKRQPTREREPV